MRILNSRRRVTRYRSNKDLPSEQSDSVRRPRLKTSCNSQPTLEGELCRDTSRPAHDPATGRMKWATRRVAVAAAEKRNLHRNIGWRRLIRYGVGMVGAFDRALGGQLAVFFFSWRCVRVDAPEGSRAPGLSSWPLRPLTLSRDMPSPRLWAPTPRGPSQPHTSAMACRQA